MQTRSLAQTVFAALEKQTVAARMMPSADEWTVLTALRNSVTSRDQILQRRLGMAVPAAKETF
ncbi:MAG: hypothetical protein ACKVP2_05840 [Burkholderiales bacterium]